MNKNKNKKLITIIAISICVIMVAAITITIFSQQKGKPVTEEQIVISDQDKKIAELYSAIYEKPVDEIIDIWTKLNNWDDVNIHLTQEKFGFLDEEKLQLIEEGYEHEDIDEAELIALENSLDANGILKERGKGSSKKSWKKVKKEFNLK